MAHGKEFYDEKLSELVKLYKGGATIAELKKKWRCNGNPLVARLKEAGVYKAGAVKAKARTAKPKAAPKPASKPRRQPRTATKAAPADTKAQPPAAPVATAWTPEEEAEIARIMAERNLDRKSAIQYMRRNKKPVDPLAQATPAPV